MMIFKIRVEDSENELCHLVYLFVGLKVSAMLFQWTNPFPTEREAWKVAWGFCKPLQESWRVIASKRETHFTLLTVAGEISFLSENKGA